MECAVIIMYDGNMPSRPAQKAAAAAIAEYGFMNDTDNIKVYTLDQDAILQAIVSKAIEPEKKDVVLNEKEAISIVFEVCKDQLQAKDYGHLGAVLSYAVSKAIMNGTNPNLIRAIKVLSESGVEKRISQPIQKQYYMNKNALDTIKWIHDLYVKDESLCPGK